MDKLMSMRVFATVTQLGSFAAAAEKLGISNTMCSKFIRDLEKNLDARLLNRTTRQLSLTEVGSIYHKKVIDILTKIEDAEQCVNESQNNAIGTLRIMAPPSLGSFHIARAIKGYKQQYPNIRIELILSDNFHNLVELGIDLAFRVGKLEDSSIIALKLSSSRLIVCASPDYLKKNGTPKTLDDLDKHACLGMTDHLVLPPYWTFSIENKKIKHKLKNNYLRSNMADSLRVAAINGSGLTQLPSYMIGLDIQADRLRPVLETYEPNPLAINLIYPHRKHMSLKIRSFVVYIRDYFSPPPYWDKWIDERKKE